MTDEWGESAGAYVLGALPAGERRGFETHLSGCSSCRQAVAEMAGIPGLLATVSPTDLADPPPVADTLLPHLLAQVRRRRLRLVLGSGLTAAALVAGAVLTLQLTGGPPAPATAAGVAMHAVRNSPITAKAALTSREWGTAVVLTCSYEPYAAAAQYSLVATSQSGRTQHVATWEAVPDRVSTITGSVGWSINDIASLQIRAADGTTVLNLDR